MLQHVFFLLSVIRALNFLKKSRKTSAATEEDTLPERMSQLNNASPSSTHSDDDQHQTAPSHFLDLAESRPTPAADLARPTMSSTPKEPSEEDGYHKGPKIVIAWKTTEQFAYDVTGSKKMFHATVATETEFFRVMVFDVDLQKMFSKRKPIAFTDYFGSNGSLIIHKASSVSVVTDNSKISISKELRKNANATPKISELHSRTREMPVNGVWKVTRIIEGNNCIRYAIMDQTGEIKVVVSGRLTSVNCRIGDRIKLVGFELTTNVDECFLRAGRYSYMEVIKPKNENQ